MSIYKYKCLNKLNLLTFGKQVLQVPHDNNEIEAKYANDVQPVIVDSIGNQELPIEIVESVGTQDVNQDLT